MALLLHIFFLVPYSLMIAMWGNILKIGEAAPYYFIPIYIYLFRKSHYPHLCILLFMTGLFSDVFEDHTWASHACFFILFYLFLSKLSFLKFVNTLWSYLLVVLLTFYGMTVWEIIITKTPFAWGQIHYSAFLTLSLSAALYPLFKGIRLGWGCGKGQNDMHILNG